MKKFGALEEEQKSDPIDDTTTPKFKRHRRPVLDPWERKEQGDKSTRRVSRVPEYYDEDDEGFEYIEDDDDDDEDSEEYDNDNASSPQSTLSVKHLIAPKPAGGQGSSESIAAARSNN